VRERFGGGSPKYFEVLKALHKYHQGASNVTNLLLAMSDACRGHSDLLEQFCTFIPADVDLTSGISRRSQQPPPTPHAPAVSPAPPAPPAPTAPTAPTAPPAAVAAVATAGSVPELAPKPEPPVASPQPLAAAPPLPLLSVPEQQPTPM
jgi:histone deacetylase complex regulatory component SIN3